MAAGSYSFGTTCVDASRLSVTRDGVPVSLEPKAMDVLLYLLVHRDRLVTKDELLDAVWKDTFVTPNALTRAIAQVRKALGDDAHEARVIETVSKRGYRIIAPVIETPAPDPAGQTPPSAPPVEASAGPPGARAHRRDLVTAVLIALVVVGGITAVVWSARRPEPARAASDIAITRFTTRQGYDSLPAISPDGRSVVFVSDRTGSLELYQTGMTTGAPEVALTNNGGRNSQPEWSPDGKWVAFRSERLRGIWVVPAAGGTSQQIVDFGSDPSWSPDSERLVFVSDGTSSATQSSLWTVRRDGSDRKAVTFTSPMAGSFGQPSWSHNGRLIAFSLNTGSALRDLWLTTVDGHVVRKVAAGLTGQDVRWAPDDDGLFWGGLDDQRLSRLMYLRINPETGEPIGAPEGRVAIDGGLLDGLSLTREGRALFGIARFDSNLWQVDVRGGKGGEPARLTNDTVRTTYPRISGDGRIAFIQFVEGRQSTAWVLAPDGTKTPLLSSGTMHWPQWSRDGRRIFVMLDGKAVWVDLDTRRATPIPVTSSLAGTVHLSPDDSGLLSHRADASGVFNIWLNPFDGTPSRQMTFDLEGASYGAYSPDGKWIGMQLTRGADTWLGVMPAQSGATIVPLVKDRGQSWLYTWSPGSDRMAFAGERDGVWNIYDVERASGTVRQLTYWTGREGFVRYPAWAPSGDRLVFERFTRTSSLWSAKLW